MVKKGRSDPNLEQKKLYLMISHTDTGIGKLIRFVTGYPYNHVCMTLDPAFRSWFSFARYIQDTPLYGGFIREPVERYLAKGQRIDVRVFAVDISREIHDALAELFTLAGKQDPRLRYNLFSLVTLAFGVDVPIPGAYTCLGFANRVLGTDHRSIKSFDAHLASHMIYEGTLNDLAPDSGCRDDLYFTRLGFLRGTAESLKAIGSLIRFALTPGQKDPVDQFLNQKGVQP